MKIRHLIYVSLMILLTISLSLTVYFAVQAFRSDAKLSQSADFNRPRYHFVLIPEEMDNPYWHQVENGAKAAGAELDAVIEYNGPVQTDVEEHIKVMEMAIAAKVDGIITQGLSEKMTPVINKAIQQGIPVVTVDTDAPDSRRLAYVGTANYAAGKLAGNTLIKETGGQAKVGIVTGSLESVGQKLRVKGFRDAVRDETGIDIVAVESSHISKVQAAEKAYDIFIKHPDVTAFFGTSALDGLGISATMQSVGKTNDVYILAFDALPQTLDLIKEGKIEATIAQQPYEMGYKSIELMAKIASGENVMELNPTGTRVIHPSDLPLETPSASEGGEAP